MATGSSVNKRILDNMLNSDQGIVRVTMSSDAHEIEPYQNVVYITHSAITSSVVLPDPAESKGQAFFILVVTDSSGNSQVRYHKGSTTVNLLADYSIVASSLAGDFTAANDKLYVVSDGERYHVLAYTCS